ncbi:MAG: DUF3298 and DUF4163 domain-containing protein [Bacteroidales bacterium]|nr:DUF3298 and DUF4163 domain-containing protein [Bacteroidales bacterium]MDD4822678.1 DUF3298 and DUF4163 domain-containing protein [Bacteroidales bacterium]
MNNKILLFTVVVISILNSCKDKPIQENRKLEFTTHESKDTIYLFDTHEKIGSALSLSFTYPVSQDSQDSLGQLQHAFISLFLGEEYANQTPDIAIDQYVKKFQSQKASLEEEYTQLCEYAKEDKLEPRKDLGYFMSVKDSVIYNENGILSLLVTTSSYTGGAHGSTTKKVRTLTTKGTILTEDDIFAENYTDDLKNILVDKLLIQNKAKDINELSELGFIFTEGIVPNGNFYVTKEGITYVYGAYEIACYAIGISEVFLPFDDIRILLRKKSPISFLL